MLLFHLLPLHETITGIYLIFILRELTLIHLFVCMLLKKYCAASKYPKFPKRNSTRTRTRKNKNKRKSKVIISYSFQQKLSDYYSVPSTHQDSGEGKRERERESATGKDRGRKRQTADATGRKSERGTDREQTGKSRTKRPLQLHMPALLYGSSSRLVATVTRPKSIIITAQTRLP